MRGVEVIRKQQLFWRAFKGLVKYFFLHAIYDDAIGVQIICLRKIFSMTQPQQTF